MRSDSDIAREEEFLQREKARRAQQKLEHEVFERAVDIFTKLEKQRRVFPFIAGNEYSESATIYHAVKAILGEELSKKIINEMEGK